jgi:hypothetical protein
MPDVTLRRAAQIRNALGKKIDELNIAAPEPELDVLGRRRRRNKAAATSPLSVHMTVDVDTTSAETIGGLRGQWLQRLDRFNRLLDTQTRITNALSHANERCGVQPLVSEQVAVLRRQKLIKDTLAALETYGVFSPSDYNTKRSRLVERLAQPITEISAYGGYGDEATPRDRIAVSILTQEDRDELHKQLIAINRRLTAIDDSLVALNTTHKVSITEQDYEFLREEAIA